MLIRAIRRSSSRRRPSAALRSVPPVPARHSGCESRRNGWASARRPTRGARRPASSSAGALRRQARALLDRLASLQGSSAVARLSRLMRAGPGARELRARMRQNARRVLDVTRAYFGLVSAA